MKKTVLQIVLGIAIIVLAYLIFESIMQPVRFNAEKDRRRAVVINRLKDIRKAQITYKSINGKYVGDFDTLIDFLKNGKFPVVRKIGNPEDSTAVLIRDTTYVSIADSLFPKGYPFDSLKYIPFSTEKFKMSAGEIEKGKVKVHVFEVFAKNEYFLKGLDETMYKKEEGLQLGSMEEPTTDGNWE